MLHSPGQFMLHDLRAGCCLQTWQYQQALEDALQCTTLNPSWQAGGWLIGWLVRHICACGGLLGGCRGLASH